MRMPNITTILAVAAAFAAAPWAVADAPPGPYFNGFETVTRVASGSSSTYANGAAPETGSYYARLGIEPTQDDCGGKPWLVGPFTRWGGYSAIFRWSNAPPAQSG